MNGKAIDKIAKDKGLTPSQLGKIAGSTPKKKRRFMLKKDRNCDSKCPLFYKCMYQPISKDYEGKCALANADIKDSTKDGFLKLLIGEEEDRFEVIKSLLSKVYTKTLAQGDLKEDRNTMYDIAKINEYICGKKVRNEIKGEVKNEITINDVWKLINEEDENE